VSLRLGFDVDGVLADFHAAFGRAARRVLRRDVDVPDTPDQPAATLRQHDIERVWKTVEGTVNWWLTLSPCEPDQIPRLYDTARRHGWEVFFLTKRPATAGETVQLQTQYWLEQHGFYLPSVVTVPGSRGELANSLRLDLVVDDLFANCVEVISGSLTRAILLLRDSRQEALKTEATERGIGVVATLGEAISVLDRVQDIRPARQGRLWRLADWFTPPAEAGAPIPPDPRAARSPAPPRPPDA
jgi:hypothetical protein